MTVAPNPELVQSEDWADPDYVSENTPVFLIHDGGGTTFAYHCLNSLGRYVYGLHNPYFRTGQAFHGGLPQMARLYVSWIKRTVASPDFPIKKRNIDGTINILLGGWSLGGFLSLEMARWLAEDTVVRVGGILMVDSVYPGDTDWKSTSWIDVLKPPHAKLGDVDEELALRASARERNRILARRCMANAVLMVSEWELPRWEGRLAGKRPRAILLRAKMAVPTPGGEPSLELDRNRGDRALGWDRYAEDMFEEVIDVEGHHFQVFAPERVDGISKVMGRALDRLDEMGQGPEES